jgi:membrane protease YdiL (CAAX protease family)
MLGLVRKGYSVRTEMKDQVPRSASLPGWSILPIFFAIVFGGAIVLGPLFYFALHPWKPFAFHRTMDRALLVSALAALGYFWSRLSLAQLWPLGARAWRQLAFGYLLAFVSAQAMIGLYLALCGFTSSHLGAHQIMMRVLMALLAALLLPPLEETVFRGFMLAELVRGLGRRWGCVVAALIFMLAHFLKVPESFDHQPVHFWSGVPALGAAFLSVAQGAFVDGRGASLFLIGLILGGLFLRSGSLWINAGLHSGWIFVLLLFSGLTQQVASPHVAFLGHGDILSSPITSLVLMALGAWLWRFYPPPSAAPATGENAP